MLWFLLAAVLTVGLIINETKNRMLKEIIIKTQKQLDAINSDFSGEIYIEGGTWEEPLVLERNFENAYVVTRGNALINLGGNAEVREMRGSSQVREMRESSQVGVMWGSSQVREMRESSQVREMRESSQVREMWGSSQVGVMWERSQVGVMWGSSQVGVMRESSQVREMRGSSQVGVMWERSQVGVMWGSSQVREMRESSQVGVMWGSSQVREMRESSQVREMRESSQVREMWGSSQVGVMWERSQVGVMWGSSQVGVMWERSQVKLYGESMVSAYSAKSIECHGYNVVRIMDGRKDDVSVRMNKDSHLIVIPKFEPTISEYTKRYPVVKSGKKAILYKAVHKKDGKYISDYDSSFTYEVGKSVEHENSKDTTESCRTGLHVAHKSWAVSFGVGWDDMALLECEVPMASIVVAKDCDGKVRTGKLKVIREVPKEEWHS